MSFFKQCIGLSTKKMEKYIFIRVHNLIQLELVAQRLESARGSLGSIPGGGENFLVAKTGLELWQDFKSSTAR